MSNDEHSKGTQSSVTPELRAALRGLSAILDPVPGAWFFTRRDCSFVYVSPGACQLLGYQRDELMRRTLLDVDCRLSPPMWEQLWHSTPPQDEMTLSTLHRRRDGSKVPVEVRAVRMVLGGEDIAASYAVDQTQSEQTRAALLETEAQLRRLMAHLPDMIFRLRLTDTPRFSFVSPSCWRLLGFTPREMVDAPRGVAQFVHVDDVVKLRALSAAVQATGVEVRFQHREGNTVWMNVRATARSEEGSAGLSIEGVARDETARRDAELSNRRLLTALEQVAEAVVVTDASGRVVYTNPAYEASSGFCSGQSLMKPWRSLEVSLDEGFLLELEKVLIEGRGWKGRIQSRRGDGGRLYDEEASVSPLRDATGTVIGCVAVKRDITERIKMQEQLHQSQKLEAVGQLAGGVAHDFNNLLQIIQGNTLMLRTRSRESELSHLIEGVLEAAQRASTLVQQLLTFSRKGTVEFAPVDVAGCIRSLQEMLRRVMGANIRVRWNCDLSPAMTLGNAAQLEQVVLNLCINARDAMPDGGELHIGLRRAQPSEAPSSAREPGSHLVLSVKDEGHGMDSSVSSRLYEPFFTTKEAGRGTGLGLATVYAIVRAHGGSIEVDSAPQRGAEFRVYLPLTNHLPPSQPDSPRPASVVGGGRRVLVAEDEPGVLALTASFLRDAGFEVLPASNGLEALGLLRRHPDTRLAVLDVVMPQLGGLALFNRVEALGTRIPVVFVTGFDRDSLATVVHHAHVAIVTKPFGAGELLAKIAQVLPCEVPKT